MPICGKELMEVNKKYGDLATWEIKSLSVCDSRVMLGVVAIAAGLEEFEWATCNDPDHPKGTKKHEAPRTVQLLDDPATMSRFGLNDSFHRGWRTAGRALARSRSMSSTRLRRSISTCVSLKPLMPFPSCEACHGSSVSPRPVLSEEMGRQRRRLPAAPRLVRPEQGNHRRFPPPGAAPSRRRHLHAGDAVRRPRPLDQATSSRPRWVGEQRMAEDLMPSSFADWARAIQPEPWMGRAVKLHIVIEGERVAAE